MGYEFRIQRLNSTEMGEKGVRCPRCNAAILEPGKEIYDIEQCEHVLYHLIASDQLLAYVHPAFPQWQEAEVLPEDDDLLNQVGCNVTILVSEGIDMDVHIAIADNPIAFPSVGEA